MLILPIVWCADTGAYMIGAVYGKHRMTPRLSPKKSWEGFIAGVKDADAIYAKGMSFTPKMIAALPDKCRGIVLGTVGVDYVDVAAATARNMPVTNCPDTFIEEVADHAMTLILASWRRLVVQDQMVRKGEWAKARPMLYQFPRLMGMTLGFISFGHVARAVSKRAAPFGFQMLAYDPYIEELVMSDHGVQPVGLDELLQRSDIVSMHAPGTKDAHHLMKERHFRQMKKTSLFVNTGRGSTVDEAALIKALQEGWIAGAGLDVMEVEPIGNNNPMLGMDNVIMTAHVASMKNHVNALGAKSYQSQFEDTPDYVVMFVPGEHFLAAALEHDPALWDYAFDRRVLIATPTNLIAIARTVAAVWRQEKLAGEARQIGQLGRELHDVRRLGGTLDVRARCAGERAVGNVVGNGNAFSVGFGCV